jgi:hypothetical protein
VNEVQELFRRAFAGEMSVDDAWAEVERLQAAGVRVSAHDVAAAEADAVTPSGVDALRPQASPSAAAPYDPASGVDPTPEQYAALSGRQIVALERMLPGVGDRVKSSEDWQALATEEAAREVEAAKLAAYDQRFGSDEAFRNAELARMSRERLNADWWTLPIQERMALAADAGLTTKQFTEMAEAKDHLAAEHRAPTVTGGGV